ncbi:uncharacterized protein SPSK_04570 [Sporothrix schenckii 1099-18]|uniref:Uncharacterized protein n=1 Tax=Sporothrix schenckii 1099-18 TaxID=1397361 RepID=A0A0F2M582_SPOSC|nr:uncharacterized protein SPSK_04570 [Sporothrix schenckii 1099-18]KJR83351.1 hypothetical protein SPSK_04570 [Sporothrix schenckii 1099-18]
MEQWYGTAPGLPVSSSPRVVHVRPVRPHRPLPTLPIKVKMEPESDDEKPSAWERQTTQRGVCLVGQRDVVVVVGVVVGQRSGRAGRFVAAFVGTTRRGVVFAALAVLVSPPARRPPPTGSNWRPRRPPPTPLRDLDSLDAWETSLQANLRYHGLAGFLDEGGGGDAKPTHRDSLAYAQ